MKWQRRVVFAATLAYLAGKGDTRAVTATYFATLVDLTDVGDMAAFIHEEQLKKLRRRCATAAILKRTRWRCRSTCRAPTISSVLRGQRHLIGKELLPFDVLFWNADETRMPAAMHSFYLRNMYHEMGSPCRAASPSRGPRSICEGRDTKLLFFQRARITSRRGGRRTAERSFSGPVTFVLAASGHIAGVISPPGSKYGHWQNPHQPTDPDEWFRTATADSGSWWPVWDQWVAGFSEGTVDSREPGGGKLQPIEDAPGSYVRMRAGR